MLFMAIVASINFVVDPGEIYLQKIIAANNSKEFADKLFISENGIIQTGWNERLVKTALSRSAGDFDCVFLGSSHIMPISSVRNTGGINNQCNNLLNLGVSGGALEDISIFSYLILNNFKLPKRVFIAIDPWSLKFDMDSRYGAYKLYYEKMNILLEQRKVGENTSYFGRIVQNLFNGEYFYISVLALIENSKKEKTGSFTQKSIQYPDKVFSYKEGYAEAVTLKDGSHLNTHSYIQKQRNSSVAIGGGEYKISGAEYDPVALEYLRKLIELYRYNDVDIHLIMTPYHPNVFKKGKTKPVVHFTIVDEVVKDFSQENDVKYYGSFFPDRIGCLGDEFFDYMHPTNECLGRIDFSQ